MATLDNLVFQAELEMRRAGVPKKDMPIRFDIKVLLVNAIRIVQDEVPKDALRDLLMYVEWWDIDGTHDYIEMTSNARQIISLKSIESDGDYGLPWVEKSRHEFDSIKRYENELEQDSTGTRIYTVRSFESLGTPRLMGWDLYPAPADDRLLRLDFIEAATESGTMTLPLILHPAVVFYAAGDLKAFRAEVDRINWQYPNKYGMSPAVASTIKNEVF